MPHIIIYPIGNADTSLITLENRFMLCDYAAKLNPDDPDDRRIDLPEALREDINFPARDTIDVVAFTHLDEDHICGATEFFHLEHATNIRARVA